MSLWADTLEFLGLREPAEDRTQHTLKEVDFFLRDDVWGSTQTDAGVYITEANATGVPDVYACVNVIAQDVARCPLKLQQKSAEGDWVDAERSPMWDLLMWLPNPETTAVEFWADMTRDVQVYGKAYAEIVRDGVDRPIQLWRLDASRMGVGRNAANRKTYTYRNPQANTERVWTFDASKPPLFELTAWSWVGRCKNLIGMASALDTYGAMYFANAARPSGLLTAPKTLSDAARERLAKSWRATYGGVNNAHKVAVLEEGLEFKPMSVPNNEAQFIEMRRFVTERICGAAGVPPHKIAELSRSTNNNIEQQSRDYVQRLEPYFSAIEQACRRDLLSDWTWPKFRVVFDRERLIQTDGMSQAQAFSTLANIGVYSANDIRRKLHENPIPPDLGGNDYHMQGAMILLSGPPEPVVVQAPPEPEPDPEDIAAEEAKDAEDLQAQRAHELACAKASAPIISVDAPTHIHEGAVKVDAPVDARTTIAEGAMKTETRVDGSTINVQPPVFKSGALVMNATVNLPKPGPVQKRFDYDSRGEITTVTEVPVE